MKKIKAWECECCGDIHEHKWNAQNCEIDDMIYIKFLRKKNKEKMGQENLNIKTYIETHSPLTIKEQDENKLQLIGVKLICKLAGKGYSLSEIELFEFNES